MSTTRDDRRQFLQAIAATAIGAAFAPSIKQIAKQVLAEDPPPSRRPGMRWIGHF